MEKEMKITLRSLDGHTFEKPARDLAKQSIKIKEMICKGEKMELDVPVGSKILCDAIDYCKRHADDPMSYMDELFLLLAGLFPEEEEDDGDDEEMMSEEELDTLDVKEYRRYLDHIDNHIEDPVFDNDKELDFVKEKENEGMLFELIRAADYLHIWKLQDLICPIIMKRMEGMKDRKEILTAFNIKFRSADVESVELEYTEEYVKEMAKENESMIIKEEEK